MPTASRIHVFACKIAGIFVQGILVGYLFKAYFKDFHDAQFDIEGILVQVLLEGNLKYT